jgi:hypothetical protein
VRESDLLANPERAAKYPVFLKRKSKQEVNERLQALHQQALENNRQFIESLDKLVVPLKFSFMALLSARKCTVFQHTLIDLMDHIIKEGPAHFSKAPEPVDLYLRDEDAWIAVTKACYHLDDMAGDNRIRARPNAMRKHPTKIEYTLIDNFNNK